MNKQDAINELRNIHDKIEDTRMELKDMRQTIRGIIKNLEEVGD